MRRVCSQCGYPKDDSDFYTRKARGKVTLHSECKVCTKARVNEHRRNDPDKKHLARASVYTRELKERKKKIVNEAKARPCADCGSQFHPCAMDFDHRDAATKSFTIADAVSRSTSSVEALCAEILKCDVVCAVCHRLRTHYRGQHTQRYTRQPIRYTRKRPSKSTLP